MDFEPQRFFIGLMDFFSILLTGALHTNLLIGEVGPAVLGDRYAELDGARAWLLSCSPAISSATRPSRSAPAWTSSTTGRGATRRKRRLLPRPTPLLRWSRQSAIGRPSPLSWPP